MKKIFFLILTILFVILLATGAYFYFGNYSTGIRAGVVVKLSERGFIFKTFEGQMNIGTFGAFKNDDNQLTTVFEFSVPKERKDVIKALQEVSLSGERVNLHYEEKYFKFAWLGDSKYLISQVERVATPKQQEEKILNNALPETNSPTTPPLPPGQ